MFVLRLWGGGGWGHTQRVVAGAGLCTKPQVSCGTLGLTFLSVSVSSWHLTKAVHAAQTDKVDEIVYAKGFSGIGGRGVEWGGMFSDF